MIPGEITDPFPMSSLRAIPAEALRDLAAAGVDLAAAIEEDPDAGRTIRASAIKAFIPFAEGSTRRRLEWLQDLAETEARERAALMPPLNPCAPSIDLATFDPPILLNPSVLPSQIAAAKVWAVQHAPDWQLELRADLETDIFVLGVDIPAAGGSPRDAARIAGSGDKFVLFLEDTTDPDRRVFELVEADFPKIEAALWALGRALGNSALLMSKIRAAQGRPT